MSSPSQIQEYMNRFYQILNQKEYQCLFTGDGSEKRFGRFGNRKEDISCLYHVLSYEEYRCLKAIGHFAQIQLNPPIFPIKGMDWVEVDPTAKEWGEHF